MTVKTQKQTNAISERSPLGAPIPQVEFKSLISAVDEFVNMTDPIELHDTLTNLLSLLSNSEDFEHSYIQSVAFDIKSIVQLSMKLDKLKPYIFSFYKNASHGQN